MFRNLRQKPKHVRNQYAFWYAVGVTSIFAFIWVVSLEYRLGSPVEVVGTAEETKRGALAQFFVSAKQNFANVISANSVHIERVPTPEDGSEEPASLIQEEGREGAPSDSARQTGGNARAPFVLSATSSMPISASSTATTTPREVRVVPRGGASSSVSE